MHNTVGSRGNGYSGAQSINGNGGYNGSSSQHYKSPHTVGGTGTEQNMDEHDYSLSVSDLGNSMYNSSRGPGIAHGSHSANYLNGFNGSNGGAGNGSYPQFQDFNASGGSSTNGTSLQPPRFKY